MASSNEVLFRVLVINPNTSSRMTDALKPILARMNYADVHFDYFTAPNHPVEVDGRTYDPIPSINSGEDSAKSAWHCHLTLGLVEQYDAFLVACYSAHPLVGMLKQRITQSSRNKYVTGILEASITTSLSLVSAFDFDHLGELQKSQIKETFGIITTGSAWKDELGHAVIDMLGSRSSSRFAGVETTGLSAIELHTTPAAEVRRRICDATQRLIQSARHPVRAICLGCAGMAGMEEAVREGCVMAYGEEGGQLVRIVDGVVAGAGTLVTACKAGF